MSPTVPDSRTPQHQPMAERWSAVLPAACALHCLLTPVLIVLAPALALPHRVEVPFLVVSVLLAVAIAVPGVREHGDRRVWIPLLAGASTWLLSVAGALAPLPEHLTSPIGGLAVAAALVWNGRLRHRCVCQGTCSAPTPIRDQPAGLGSLVH